MAVIAASSVRTCLGDGQQTFAALLEGRCGVGPLRYVDSSAVGVEYGYHVGEAGPEASRRASGWLAECVREALASAGVDASAGRIPVLVGSGLRELRGAERWAIDAADFSARELHMADVVAAISPALGPVLTISNACSAAGSALALAQDLVDSGAAQVVVAAGADAMTATMLAMIGRVAERPTTRVRPFDADRTGVLLGEGAAAVVVAGDRWAGPVLAVLLATALSCDAHHETAPAAEGICRAMREALVRADRSPEEVAVVLAHGTATALNDVTEAQAIRDVLVAGGGSPWLTAIKGGIGHTSGASALMSLDVALRCLADGRIPPIVGLESPLAEAAGLRLVAGGPVALSGRVAQVDAFGFGGVNAVTLVEAPA